MPVAPGPRSSSRGSYAREGETIGRLGEVSRVIDRIWQILSPYSAKTITAADGRKYTVLGRDSGFGDPANTFGGSFHASNALDSLGNATVSVVGGRVSINDDSVVVASDAEFVVPVDDLNIYVTITKTAVDGTVDTAVLGSQTGSVPANTATVIYWPIAYVYEFEGEFVVKPVWVGDITIALVKLCDDTYLNAFGVITPAS